MPVVLARLQRQHHAFLEHENAAAAQDRLLLMPPGADAVADHERGVSPAALFEFLHDELPQVAAPRAGAAAIDRRTVDIPVAPVYVALRGSRRTDDCRAGLMSRIGLE